MKTKEVNQKEKELYVPPQLEIVEVKLERNFASTGVRGAVEDDLWGTSSVGIDPYKGTLWQ